MGKHGYYTTQNAADAVVTQGERIYNLAPALEEGRSNLNPTSDDMEAARAVLAHADQVRTALRALEDMAKGVIFKTEKRREVLLDGFLE